MKRLIQSTLLGLSLIAAGNAYADIVTVQFGGFTGAWINPSATAGSGQPTTSGANTTNPLLRWGVPNVNGNGQQSGYDFASMPGFSTMLDTDAGTSTDFTLGMFTHRNNIINAGSGWASLLSADLQLNTTVSIDGAPPIDVEFVFNFNHNETNNVADPCANGMANGSGVNINGCADIITVTTAQFSDVIVVDNIAYTINIQGFLANGMYAESFQTIEENTNFATIIANISATDISVPVSEPASLAYLATSLLGFAAIRRRFGRRR
ncbi:THxN family PEP-CTERM protein [Photobacterium sp. 1_MG-2023]|uniref:THxN family PEP-CTERM protein n=1 Tax=Photobacterium sp. 1_MG-2023 TaxID=3062646 RepID=UPI0026E4651C|nr:THxN family PEP-CTERM protein [Photobacterium sp. 1_MG-2023]MDO6708426.1 THxN family PEP-CTERM protein [Photobacterium sp. 1_MG-2023]